MSLLEHHCMELCATSDLCRPQKTSQAQAVVVCYRYTVYTRQKARLQALGEAYALGRQGTVRAVKEVEDVLMLQLGGVWCDVKGVCVTYLGLAGSQATLPQFHQGNVFLTFPQLNQDTVLSHLLFVVLIRNIPAGFELMFWLKELL